MFDLEVWSREDVNDMEQRHVTRVWNALLKWKAWVIMKWEALALALLTQTLQVGFRPKGDSSVCPSLPSPADLLAWAATSVEIGWKRVVCADTGSWPLSGRLEFNWRWWTLQDKAQGYVVWWSRAGGSSYRFAKPVADDQQLRSYIKQAFRDGLKLALTLPGGLPMSTRAQELDMAWECIEDIASVKPIRAAGEGQVWIVTENSDGFKVGDTAPIKFDRDLMIGEHTGLVKTSSGWLKAELVEIAEAVEFADLKRGSKAISPLDPSKVGPAASTDPLEIGEADAVDARCLAVDYDAQGQGYKWNGVLLSLRSRTMAMRIGPLRGRPLSPTRWNICASMEETQSNGWRFGADRRASQIKTVSSMSWGAWWMCWARVDLMINWICLFWPALRLWPDGYDGDASTEVVGCPSGQGGSRALPSKEYERVEETFCHWQLHQWQMATWLPEVDPNPRDVRGEGAGGPRGHAVEAELATYDPGRIAQLCIQPFSPASSRCFEDGKGAESPECSASIQTCKNSWWAARIGRSP